jgi:hypothetical protein
LNEILIKSQASLEFSSFIYGLIFSKYRLIFATMFLISDVS